MDQTSQVLLDLIKKSLWDIDLPDYSTLYDTPIDWNAVFEEAKIQTVAGIAAPAVPDTAPEEVRAKWKNYSYQILANYHRILAAQDELLKLLGDNNIPVAILKGTAAAIYYPHPSQRNMGDIDFLIPQDLCDIAEELLKNNGYTMTQTREDEPRHSGFVKNGVHFELHHYFTYDYSPDIERILFDGLTDLDTQIIDGHLFTSLPLLANGLVLLVHIQNHIKLGLGLRQIIDWMLFTKHAEENGLWDTQMKHVAKCTGLDTLAITTTKTCQLYLGFPATICWCNEADNKTCEDLIEYLMLCGNWGKKKGESGKIETVATNIKHQGLFLTLQRQGMYHWKAYHKHHWLKPMCWLYQVFRYTKKSIDSNYDIKQLKLDLAKSAERNDLLSRLGL